MHLEKYREINQLINLPETSIQNTASPRQSHKRPTKKGKKNIKVTQSSPY
jgi:hypothetical protein